MRQSVAYLTLHRVCVNLAHIGARVVGLHVTNVQLPRIVVVVSDAQPRIQRHHVRVYRQNRFRV